MKKIGYVDYYLDEWHAENYPKWISEASKGEMEVAYAYGAIDSPVGGMSNSEWCKRFHIELVPSIEELVDKSDYVVVLSPNNPEQHETLCQIPLRCGKRVYVDKTFAPDRATALRLFDIAEQNHTPMYSTSALRFSKELADVNKNNIQFINSRGPGTFEVYSIHQIEPIVSLMGTKAKRIMSIGTAVSPAMVIEFEGGRRAIMSHIENTFSLGITYDSGEAVVVNDCTEYFERFIANMVEFFNTGRIIVPKEETIAVATIREYAFKAKQQDGIWITLPQ